jgi:hypothetical protein
MELGSLAPVMAPRSDMERVGSSPSRFWRCVVSTHPRTRKSAHQTHLRVEILRILGFDAPRASCQS